MWATDHTWTGLGSNTGLRGQRPANNRLDHGPTSVENSVLTSEFAGSIPDGVIGISHWLNPSDRIMALRSTQPLKEMSTSGTSLWGGKGGG